MANADDRAAATQPTGSLLADAVRFAANAHEGQVRKGTRLPYIVHPMEVAAICASLTDDEEVLAAAVLHDVVEDTEATIDEIEARFCRRVAQIVSGDSEDKRKGMPAADTWRVRKEESIERLKSATDPGVGMVCLGDKLSNIRAIQWDHDALGEGLWRRFNQEDPAQHAWYYSTIAEVLRESLGDTEAWREYDKRVRAVFARY